MAATPCHGLSSKVSQLLVSWAHDLPTSMFLERVKEPLEKYLGLRRDRIAGRRDVLEVVESASDYESRVVEGRERCQRKTGSIFGALRIYKI